MNCAACGQPSPERAKFCAECGAALALRCPGCGAELSPTAKFCQECGQAVGGRLARVEARGVAAEPGVARKVVTIVFADLVGSTALHERLDAEAVRQFMEDYYAAMRGAVEAHDGRVTQLMGDGVKAVFGAPRVAEDDAIRAVRAAVEMQRAFRALLDAQRDRVGKTGLRIAVNTGEVVADDATEIIGDPVNVAARLQEQGKDGDVVIGGETQRIVASLVTLERLGSFALKGRSEAVEAYRVVSLEAPAAARAVAFVGRDEELRRLLAVYEAAVATPATKLAVLLGSPGLGKSRLLDEIAQRLGGTATVLAARCEASGGATFAPLAAALRMLLGIEGTEGSDLRDALERAVPGSDEERARIAAGIEALLAGTPLSPEETFYDVRRLLAALATERPVVLAIDDLHWAEPLLLDLIEHLVQWGAGVKLLVLAAARPELRDARSSLAVPGAVAADVVTLAGLDATSASRLAASVIGADALPAAVAGRVLTTSEGNPLFLRELVRMLVNDGVLRREGERWTLAVSVADLEIPPTIQALLAARIERLRPEERLVLERAAVVGRHFSRAAVAQLLPQGSGDLGTRLESLRRSELIEPDTGWYLGEPALRFHHVLIRDAAYRRVLKGTRADQHARLADWIEAKPGEHDETLGWHLEQAHQNLRELGTDDARAHALGERAARHLGAAGRRALARDDLPLAAGLLGRALDVLDADDPARADLALDWCEALLTAGDVGPAARAVEELGRLAAGSERLSAWHTCFAGQLAVLTDPEALRSTASAVAAAASVLAAAGDDTGEAKAHSVQATALSRLGENGACEAAIDRALAAARRVRDRRRQNACLAAGPVAALWGPSPVTRASGRCLDFVRVLRITQGSPAVEAIALRCQALLEALRGRSDAARRMIAAARRMVEELGITQQLLEVDVFAAHIDLMEGAAAAAERTLRGAYAALREHGLGIDAARAAALLGKALLAQGRNAEAEALSHESEALAGDDLKAAIAWRGVRAEALASRGEAAAAVELARAAVGIAAATDGVLDHADARLALAAALRAADRAEEAGAEETRAVALWEQKGATLLVERARATAGRTAPSVPAAASSEPARGTQRRVRGNAATVFVARLNAASADRDADALPALFSEGIQVVRQGGPDLDIQAILRWWRLFFADRDASFRLEPLATLGDSLVLCRQSWSGSAPREASFDIGAFGRDTFDVYEVDAESRVVRVVGFREERLGDAVACIYERHAELLPEGPERTRAEAIARSVALMPTSDASAGLAPDVEGVDHRQPSVFGRTRGLEVFQRGMRIFFESALDWTHRMGDVVALRPDALLVRLVESGTERASGGAFENQYLRLLSFGPDGLVTRYEMFDAERTAEALARFDALTSQPALVARRRPRENLATANVRAFEAAVLARDAGAFERLLADVCVGVSHTTGIELDRTGVLRAWSSFVTAKDLAFESEALATLGDGLALAKDSYVASGVTRGDVDVGAYERGALVVAEVDAAGRRTRDEHFAEDRLGDAVVRLYERYAELLPDGFERTRAAATARSLATILGPFDPERWIAFYAPGVAFTDHRPLGLESVVGAEALLRQLRTLPELAGDLRFHVEDVLALGPYALVLRMSNSGTLRTSGGAFERQWLQLFAFGPDGLATRAEMFPEAGADAALARFDALTTELAPVAHRRVRENAAVANLRAVAAALAARDIDAYARTLADDATSLSHSTGLELDRAQLIAENKAHLGRVDVTLETEALAALGDRLALWRDSVSSSGFTRGSLDVGPYELEAIGISEVGADGRRWRRETFPPRKLGDAVARLYERHAELLPEGPERTRATAIAQGVATWVAGLLDSARWLDPAAWAKDVAPDVELVDRRRLGLATVQGIDALRASVRALAELADDAVFRIDDVVCTAGDALVLRVNHTGTVRASGGSFEREYLLLQRFAADGRLDRIEWFDIDRSAEAVARLDALTAPTARRRVRENAASEHVARINAAVRARDAAALPGLLSETHRVVNHVSGIDLDRTASLDWWRACFADDRDATLASEPIATLGESLALCRHTWRGSASTTASLEVGGFEHDAILVYEVDPTGRGVRCDVFAPERLGDAVVRLYERHAELLPEGLEKRRAAATARTLAGWPDPPSLPVAPDVEVVDHRIEGVGTLRGADAMRRSFDAFLELADRSEARVEEILALRLDTLLARVANTGTLRATGGAFDRRFLILWCFAADGSITRWERFDVDRESEALARFDAVTAEPAAPRRRVRENAVTAHLARLNAASRARDVAAISDLLADGVEVVSRQTGGVLGKPETGTWWRLFVSDPDAALRMETVATLGDSLALCHAYWSGSASVEAPFDFGTFESDLLLVYEVDAHGRAVRTESYDRLGAALARLYERHAELLLEGPERERAAATARTVAGLLVPPDHEVWGRALAPDVEFVDRRLLGVGAVHGADALLESVRPLVELSDEYATRIDDALAVRPDALLVRWTNTGTDRASGGTYERQFLLLVVPRADGLVSRIEMFDTEREAEALARFDALTAALPARRRVRENRATAHLARLNAASRARDADAIASLLSADLRAVSSTTGAVIDRQETLDWWRLFFVDRDASYEVEALATLGDRLALTRALWRGSSGASAALEVGPFENEFWSVYEVDAEGRAVDVETSGQDRQRDAVVRLYERYAETLPAGSARTRAEATARSVAVMERLTQASIDAVAAVFAPGVAFKDHRSVVGLPPARGADELRRRMASWFDPVEEAASTTRDIVELRPNGMLVHAAERGRDRAGADFERRYLIARVFDASGRLSHIELFDPADVDVALARFDEIAAEPVPAAPRRRVRPNAATENGARLAAAMRARDATAAAALYAPDAEVLHHPTGSTLDRDGVLDIVREALQGAQDVVYEDEPLASLGAVLALLRTSVHSPSGGTFYGLDVGPSEREHVALIEVDAAGRRRRSEIFDPGHLGNALVRLHERHAELLPAGPERARTAGTGRSLAAMLGAIELERYRTALAPDVAYVDHRRAALPAMRGAEEYLRALRVLVETSEHTAMRVDDVLALVPGADLLRWTNHGSDRSYGGAYERTYLRLGLYGDDGRLVRSEFFEDTAVATALASFDALAAEPRPARRRPVRPNAATRHAERFDAALAARDLDAIERLLSAPAESVHHPTGATWDRDGILATFRGIASWVGFSRRAEPLATLGDSLGLFRDSVSAAGFADDRFDVGAVERESINLIEVDARGLRSRTEVFAPDRLHQAIVRLYERRAELVPAGPERAQAETTALTLARHFRGWGPSAGDRFAPGLEFVDHRPLGIGRSRGAERFLDAVRVSVELEQLESTQVREILALGPDLLLVHWPMRGTEKRGGGVFERDLLRLFVFGEDGRFSRIEWFEPGQEAEALARHEALSGETVETPRIENAATRAIDRRVEAWNERDWQRFADSLGPAFRVLDRRAGVRLELDRDGYLTFLHPTFEMTSRRSSTEVLATRGERLALVRALFQGAGSDVGPTEIESLQIAEVDASGAPIVYVVLDPDALDAAFEELEARYDAGEAAPYARTWEKRKNGQHAIAARDWEALAATFAPGFVAEDHRPIGLLSLRSGADYVASIRVLLDVAPDAVIRTYHVLGLDERRILDVSGSTGTREGGAFETSAVAVQSLGPDGRIQRLDLYGLDQLDEARARYEELRPDLLRIPPNAATRQGDRWQIAFEARDWQVFRGLYAPELVYEDRRHGIRTSGGLEMFEQNNRLVADAGARVSRTLLATAGDHLALERMVFRREDRFEAELLMVCEVDAQGRAAAVVLFDLDDRAAASRELFERWARHGSMSPAVAERGRAHLDHDIARFRSLLPADFVFHDHRKGGAGRLDHVDEFAAWTAGLFQQSPDAIIEPLYFLALEPHRSLAVSHTFGTNRSGGAFESVYLSVNSPSRVEIFDLEDLDCARTCFEELRPDPLRIPPNAAWLAHVRSIEAHRARDWDAMRGLTSPGFTFEDRGRKALVSGDVETWVANASAIPPGSHESRSELLGTAGDRLALGRTLWRGELGGGPVEREHLRLTELDAEGRTRAVIWFDLDDRAAAFEEMHGRFVAGEAGGDRGQATLAATFRVFNRRDWAGWRLCFREDCSHYHDHRTLGWGEITLADWIASIRAWVELAPDVQVEVLRILRWNPHGAVLMTRGFGTREGGAFEQVPGLAVFIIRDALIERFESFDAADAERALARFEELCAGREEPGR